jgi:hypothetical protein
VASLSPETVPDLMWLQAVRLSGLADGQGRGAWGDPQTQGLIVRIELQHTYMTHVALTRELRLSAIEAIAGPSVRLQFGSAGDR